MVGVLVRVFLGHPETIQKKVTCNGIMLFPGVDFHHTSLEYCLVIFCTTPKVNHSKCLRRPIYGAGLLQSPPDYLAIVYGLDIPKIVIEEKELTMTENVLYGGFHRLGWAIAVSWVIFTCCRGYGGTHLVHISLIF